jgi:para-aminobenzoate synthetase component I
VTGRTASEATSYRGNVLGRLQGVTYPRPVAPLRIPELAALPAVVRRNATIVIAAEPVEFVSARGAAAFDTLDHLTPGWWVGALTYDLGRAVERVTPRLVDDLGIPDLVFARYDARLVRDAAGVRLEGSPKARTRLEELLERAPEPAAPGALEQPFSSLDRDSYEAGVRAVVALIEAGECYQVNLTRRLTWDEPTDPVALHGALARVNPAPHAALCPVPRPGAGTAYVVSASPERFLTWRGRDVETRPIKGTNADPGALHASAKDRAENVMIVDLARNDFGRVCEYGSVHTHELCTLESHPGLHHLVSTVRGRLRDDVGIGALVRATFPPASVTGAPKPRVLQAIEDLEPVRRGVYCGAVGWIDTERNEADLAVAIRTFVVEDDRTHLGAGSGIVADSDPAAEWQETELKVARLLRAAGVTSGARTS